MKIRVTAKDIENGGRLRPSLCPIGLALRNHFKGRTIISVGRCRIRVGRTVYQVPRKVALFIWRFDFLARQPWCPFTFTLRKKR
jgi:hypothetical protein